MVTRKFDLDNSEGEFNLIAGKFCPLFIDGEWRYAQLGATFVDLEVATRKPYADVADGTSEDMTQAIEAAAVAQPSWEGVLPYQRAAYFHRAAELLERHQEYFVDALIRETGSTRSKSVWECFLTTLALREAAALCTRATGEIYPSNFEGKINYASRSAAGVVGVISPWNSPLYLSARGFVYAVALGNTAVIKPSEESPLTGGALLAELFKKAGFPAGVVNVVSCSRENAQSVGDRMISDPRVARLSFTGSTAVGKRIGEACALQLKRVILELGGKNPVIVLADADLDYAVDCAAYSAYLHQGQICMSCDKIIVASELYDSFVEKLIVKAKNLRPMDPSDESSIIGPIINDRQLERIDRLVSEAVATGASLKVGGAKHGAYYLPTVLTDVTSDMRIFHEEVFGPVVMVFSAESEEEMVSIANDTTYGLSAAIITADIASAQTLARWIKAGMVHINDSCVQDDPHCPFGGVKHSGWVGKWGSAGAIEAFTEQRWISVQETPRQFAF